MINKFPILNEEIFKITSGARNFSTIKVVGNQSSGTS